MMPTFGALPPDVTVRVSELARRKAVMASRLKSNSRASCTGTGSRRRMLRPPCGMAKSVGVTKRMRSRLPSTMPVASTVSCITFIAAQVPVKRDIAQP